MSAYLASTRVSPSASVKPQSSVDSSIAGTAGLGSCRISSRLRGYGPQPLSITWRNTASSASSVEATSSGSSTLRSSSAFSKWLHASM